MYNINATWHANKKILLLYSNELCDLVCTQWHFTEDTTDDGPTGLKCV
jgi:hypothetical protein